MGSRRIPKRPPDRGQSEVLGVVLLLAVTVLGLGAIAVIGTSALDDAEHRSDVGRTEHTMTLFDSRVARVALGDTDVQTVRFGRSDGTYAVDPAAGTITVKHNNWDGTDDEILDTRQIGEVTYKSDDTTVAYQAGGVWRTDGNGGSAMVSPPEFHYRGNTLTLPIITVTGSGSSTGPVTGTVTSTSSTTVVFPSSSTNYGGNPTNPEYANPADEGQIVIEVQTEYHTAWAEFFRSRTDGTVTVDDSTTPPTVSVELIATGTTGAFGMMSEGSALEIRGVQDHSLTNFDITLVPDNTDSANFANLQWSMYAEDGDTQFEVHLRHQNGNDCNNGQISATVYYSPPDGDADTSDDYHGWYDSDAFTTECYDADDDGVDDEVRLKADFVDDEDGDDGVHDAESGDPDLEYTSLASNRLLHFNPSGSSLIDPAEIEGHSFTPNWETDPNNYNSGDTETIDRVLNHYFSNMGDLDLTVDDHNSNSVTEGGSNGNIDYVGSSQYLTYLHITVNEIEIEFS